MGVKLSKWQSQDNIPESVDTTGRYEATGDIFTDLLRSYEVTDKQRKVILNSLRKRFPKSYEKRFGSKSVEQVLAEVEANSNNKPDAAVSTQVGDHQEVDERNEPARPASYVANPMTVEQFHSQAKVDTSDELMELFMQILESDKLSKKKKRALLEHFEEIYPGSIEKMFGEEESEDDGEMPDSGRGSGAAGDRGDKKSFVKPAMKAEYV